MNKLSLLTLILLLSAAMLTSCDKVECVIPPQNMDLSNKPLPEVRAILNGKWQLHYLKGGICGFCQYPRLNEFYTFSNGSSHIKWTIDKTVWADTSITWFKQEWINKQINVMEFYANDSYMHHLSPDYIQNDTLVMYEPGYDGMTYHFTRATN